MGEEDIMGLWCTRGRGAVRSSLWAVVICGVVIAGCSSGQTDDEAAALETIEDAYASFNDGDVAVWVEIRDRGSEHPSDERRQLVIDDMTAEVTEQVQGGARFEDIDCESQGLGEWPVADAGPVEGHYFTCDTTFVAPDGSERAEAFEWVVDEGEIIAVRSNG